MDKPDLTDDRTRAHWLDCLMTRRTANEGHIHLNSDDWGELVAVLHRTLSRPRLGPLDLDAIEKRRDAGFEPTRLERQWLIARLREAKTAMKLLKRKHQDRWSQRVTSAFLAKLEE